MSGGGGDGQTSTTSLPDWARPAVESSLNKAVDLEAVGGFSHVEGLTPAQRDALQRQTELGSRGGVLEAIATDAYGGAGAYRDAAAGTGLFGADAYGKQLEASKTQIEPAIAQLLGQQAGTFSRSGNLGGARADALSAKAATDAASQIATQELAARRQGALSGAQGLIGSTGALQQGFTTGTNLTGQVGALQQEQGQREGDRAYQGIQRLFGLYGNPAIGSKTIQTGGGGK